MKLRICKETEIRACLLVLNIVTLMSLFVLMVYVQNLNQNQSLKDSMEAMEDAKFGKFNQTTEPQNMTFPRRRRAEPGLDVMLNTFTAKGSVRLKLLRADSKKNKHISSKEFIQNDTNNVILIRRSRKESFLINSRTSKHMFEESVANRNNTIANFRGKQAHRIIYGRTVNQKNQRPYQPFRKSTDGIRSLDISLGIFNINTNTHGDMTKLKRNDLTIPSSRTSTPKDSDSPPHTGEFQEVGDGQKTYVFSAIFDDVTVPVIRVITLIRDFNDLNPNLTFTCWYGNDVTRRYPATLQVVPEPDWGYSYRSAFIICQVPENQFPTEISVMKAGETQVKSTMRVIYPLVKRWRIIKCFSVLHSNFNDTMQLVQQIEISLLFGVEHFVAYIRDVHAYVMMVLQMYEKIGILDIIPWNISLNNTEIHYHGQLAVLQECLYRHLHVTDYILTGDTDELFVPKMNISVLETIHENLKDRSFCSALVLRQSFFPLNLSPYSGPFPAKPEVQKLKLTFLLQTTHLKVLDPDIRSKLIIKPTGVEILGIHTVKKFRRGKGGCVCPSNYCLLHHYREIPENDLGSYRVTDTFLHTYSDVIVRRVKGRLDNLTIT